MPPTVPAHASPEKVREWPGLTEDRYPQGLWEPVWTTGSEAKDRLWDAWGPLCGYQREITEACTPAFGPSPHSLWTRICRPG